MIVKNRMVVPAMGTGFSTPDGLVTRQMLDYYEARANGGFGMVIVENVVLALGMRPNNILFQQPHARGIEAHLAGDCWHPGRIADAVSDGARLGHIL